MDKNTTEGSPRALVAALTACVLVESYARTLDARDEEAFARLWTLDASLATPGGVIEGRRQISQWMREMGGEPGARMHINLQTKITRVDEDEIAGETEFVYVSPGDAPLAVLARGRYFDTYANADGWRFRSRIIEFEPAHT